MNETKMIIKSHKTNIDIRIFYVYISVIFLFITIFSINFLISNLVEKNQLIWSIVPKWQQDQLKPGTEEYEKVFDQAKQTWNLWSVPSYLGGISTVFIFFIFVLFGKTKVAYGYFFRTIWSILFLGAATFIFFINGMPMWQKIIDFILMLALAVTTLFDLLKVNRRREDLRMEIRNEWRNKQHNRNLNEEVENG